MLPLAAFLNLERAAYFEQLPNSKGRNTAAKMALASTCPPVVS